MNTRDTAVRVRGVLQCAKVHCCTCTRSTHFGSTAGKSIPMCNPSCHSMLSFVLIYTCPAVHLGSPHLCSLALVCAHCHLFMLSSLFVCWSLFVPACLSLLSCTGWPSCLLLLVSSFSGPHSMLTPCPLLLSMPFTLH